MLWAGALPGQTKERYPVDWKKVGPETLARFTELLLRMLARPVRLLTVGPPVAPSVGAVGVRSERRGSMLRWCGWTLRAARRGPPAPAW